LAGQKTTSQPGEAAFSPSAPPTRETEWWSWDEPFLPKIFKHFDSELATKFRVLDKLQAELNQLESLGMWTPSSRTSRPLEDENPQPQPPVSPLRYDERLYHLDLVFSDLPPGWAAPGLTSLPPKPTLLPPGPTSLPPASKSSSTMLIGTTSQQQPDTVSRPRSDGPSTLLRAADFLGNSPYGLGPHVVAARPNSEMGID